MNLLTQLQQVVNQADEFWEIEFANYGGTKNADIQCRIRLDTNDSEYGHGASLAEAARNAILTVCEKNPKKYAHLKAPKVKSNA